MRRRWKAIYTVKKFNLFKVNLQTKLFKNYVKIFFIMFTFIIISNIEVM